MSLTLEPTVIRSTFRNFIYDVSERISHHDKKNKWDKNCFGNCVVDHFFSKFFTTVFISITVGVPLPWISIDKPSDKNETRH